VRSENALLAEERQYAKKYGSLARSAPADIQSFGLGQTLAFWRAKGYDKGQPKNNEYTRLVEHTSAWLGDHLELPNDATQNLVRWIAQTASVSQYRRAMVEAIAFLTWLKRFAEAELGEEE
jgi:CRISPR-associated protein Cmr5